MILMSKNDINDVLGVFGRVWGCSEMKGFEVLDRWRQTAARGEISLTEFEGGQCLSLASRESIACMYVWIDDVDVKK